MKRIAVGLVLVVAIAVAAAWLCQKQLGAFIFQRAAQEVPGRDELAGLALGGGPALLQESALCVR